MTYWHILVPTIMNLENVVWYKPVTKKEKQVEYKQPQWLLASDNAHNHSLRWEFEMFSSRKPSFPAYHFKGVLQMFEPASQ